MNIEIKKSKIHNRGVFSSIDIKENEIIEICPIILLNENDTKIIDDTHLYNYYFAWENKQSAICLAYGSLYNHSYQANAKYIKDFSNNTIIFIAIKNIKKNEEITVNYNGDPSNLEPVWFEKDKNKF
ncbi:SET domain-containing protein-lysine N-methyltransferase [bacterium]|nr:SET domain-containing protein-lysine N-methyltransferase [bacterium]